MERPSANTLGGPGARFRRQSVRSQARVGGHARGSACANRPAAVQAGPSPGVLSHRQKPGPNQSGREASAELEEPPPPGKQESPRYPVWGRSRALGAPRWLPGAWSSGGDAGTAGGRRQPRSEKREDQKDLRRCPGGRAAGLGSPRSPLHPADPGPFGLGLKGESPRVGLGDSGSGARTRPAHRVVPPLCCDFPAGRAHPEPLLGGGSPRRTGEPWRGWGSVGVCGPRCRREWSLGRVPGGAGCQLPPDPRGPAAVQLIGCEQPPPLPSCSSNILLSIPPFFISAFLPFFSFFLFFFSIFHLFLLMDSSLCSAVLSRSVVPDSLRPHRLCVARQGPPSIRSR